MQDDIRRLLALLLISAANADEYIHPREEKIIRITLGSQVYASALQEYKDADEAGKDALQKELSEINWDRKSREQALSLLKRIFMADGKYDPSEGSWMKKVWEKISSSQTKE